MARIKTKIIFSVIITSTLLLGLVLSSVLYTRLFRYDVDSILKRAQSIAICFDKHDIEGFEKYLSNPDADVFTHLKHTLEELRSVNTDLRFIYLMGVNKNKAVYFYGDSEPKTSEDYSPAGQLYSEAPTGVYAAFAGSSTTSMYMDRWGNWLSAFAPVHDDSGNIVAVVGMDLDYEKLMENLLIQSSVPIIVCILLSIIFLLVMRQFEKGEQYLKQKSEYLSIAAHDLRTPLNGLQWLTQATLEQKTLGKFDDVAQNKFIATIKSISAELLSSVNDLLNAAALDQNKRAAVFLQDVDVKPILEDVSKINGLFTKEKNLTISLVMENKPVITKVDPDKFKRVMNNLVSNAVKYSKNNTTISIGLEDHPTHVLMYVKDQGIGIPVSDREKVFKGYFRSENAKKITTQGTGLGLYYAKNVIKTHNGVMWIDSKEDVGTTVYISLPKN